MKRIGDGPPTCTAQPPRAASEAKGAASGVTVFYDGACPLCAVEVGFYRGKRGAERVDWIDVSTCSSASVAPGLTREQALKRFHVRDADGRLLSGGRAFALLWTALPGYAWLGRLFRLRPLAWAIDLAYEGFLRWRPQMQAVARRVLSRQQS